MNLFLQRCFENDGTVYRVTLTPRESRTGISWWTNALVFETDDMWVGAVIVARDFQLHGLKDDDLRRLLGETTAGE
ncbi:MAG: hypothetical protein M3497_08965 [Gemmatimonadota bacterium]|nr:hypothetical protein [Gemmatimonadota bacterium]